MDDGARRAHVALADRLMNNALVLDKMGKEDWATVQLEVAERLMLMLAAHDALQMETEGDE